MTKAAAKKPAASKAKPKPKASPSGTRRIDGAGHMNPEHAERLHVRSNEGREEDPVAFVQDHSSADDLAEELGEQTVAAMTTGQDDFQEGRDEQTVEERGGPFVETSGNSEFADGLDESNIEGATREPFPRT
jgi:hypothetical protein